MMIRCFVAIFTVLLFSSVGMADITPPYFGDWDSFSEGTVINQPNFYPFYSGLAADRCGYTTITSGAAMGGSGKGIRYLIGNDKNANSGSFAFILSTPTNEVWARFYKRYSSGFAWQGGGPSEEKVLWFSNTSNTNAILYEHSRDQCWEGLTSTNDAAYFWLQNGPVDQVVCGASNTGWKATQGGSTGDGKWHAYEVHIKKGTTETSPDGVFQAWVDGVIKFNRTNIATGDGWPRNMLHFQVNQDRGANVPCAPVDFDNLAIYTTIPPNVDSGGRPFIGLLSDGGGSVDTTPPAVTITTSNPSSITTNNLTVTGTSTDGTGVSSCKWRVGSPPDASNGTACTGTTAFSCSTTGYSSGVNSLYVGCSDPAGNWGSIGHSVNYSPPGTGSTITPGTLIFSEDFEANIDNTNGWIDGHLSALTTSGHTGKAAQLTWAQGAQLPTNINTVRRDIGTGHDRIYVEFWVKFATGWVGSGQAYHPHIMWIRGSDDVTDDVYGGPAFAYQNNYLEFNGTRPVWLQQDGKRVNTTMGTPPTNISGLTETRSTGACNGIKANAYQGTFNDCYNISDNNWYSQIGWKSTTSIPFDTWTKMAYAIKLNTVTGGVGNPDGEVRIWMNGIEIMHQTNVILRPGSDSDDLLRQFAISPYIGDGSPVAQTMYLDDLKAYDYYTESGVTAASASIGTQLITR